MIKFIKKDANDYCDTLADDIYEIIYADLECNVPKGIAHLIAEFSINYFTVIYLDC